MRKGLQRILALGLVLLLAAAAALGEEAAGLLPALELQDEAAQGIARKAAEDLCALAVALWKKSGMQGGELALLGSIFRYFAPIRRLVEEKLQALLPQVAVIEPRGSAALGAAKLAREI